MFLLLLLFATQLAYSQADCTFQRNPDEYLNRQIRVWRDVHQNTAKIAARSAKGSVRNVDPSEVNRRNFIDDYILSQLESRSIAAAPRSGDDEFLRRVSLDLTGRIPTPKEIREFLGDSDEKKRDKAIDRLLASDAFVDKWVMYFGDLLKNNAFPSNFDRQQDGRNAYYNWIRTAVKIDMSIKDMSKEMVRATGNSFDPNAGASNYPIASKTSMGPIQDTYDTMMSMTMSTFLGMGETDCLLCHSGRGHLEQVNLWASRRPRSEAWRVAAFFSRLDMPQRNVPATDKFYRSFDTKDKASGTYDLNTNWGNRPERAPLSGVRSLTPEYWDGTAPKDGEWRSAFAELMVNDPMFARNFANRLWKEMFNLALVEPVDSMDPARLDLSNPPDAPWTLQATHPELLEKLASFLKAYDFNLRGFLRTIAQSSAYQMSSRYDGEWKFEYVNSFARHYPRRLMAEEVHDAITLATELPGSYTVLGFEKPLTWAMQLPEPAEPRSNGAVATFLNFFLRGNRDSQPRSSSLSILQQMYLMNDSFVTNRTKVGTSPTLIAISKISSNSDAVEELFLLLLSRKPSENERDTSVDFLSKSTNATERNQFIEDLAWALINKPDFLFSY